MHRWLVGVLLLIGMVVAIGLGRSYHDSPSGILLHLTLVALAAALAGARGTSAALGWLYDRVRNPGITARARVTVFIWLAASVYLTCLALLSGRGIIPRVHDECSYTIQAHLLAHGRLWQPQHPLADFFETFHFLSRPVYASIYFPGTALLNVPGVWLGMPSWVMPVIMAGLIVALCYRIVTELADGVAGLLVALIVLSSAMFRAQATMVMAQMPAAMLGLLTVWAWLHWRGQRKAHWALLAGVFAGWGAITRPIDALAFALPVALAMAYALWRQPRRMWATTGTALLVGAAPFLALQGAFNVGVTGKILKTPYVAYLEQNQPGSVYGSAAVPGTVESFSRLPQKQIYLRELMARENPQTQPGFFPRMANRAGKFASVVLHNELLAVLAFVAFLGGRRWRWVVLAQLPAFFLLYALNPFFLFHYAVPMLAAAAFAAVIGARVLAESAPPTREKFVGTFLTTALLLLACSAIPGLNPGVHDSAFATPLLDSVEQSLKTVAHPAIILFRFAPGSSVDEEPVYNTGVAWPDDAPIIRAHDLGPRDCELLRYYAARQPGRTFYLFDRADRSLTCLGNADEAAAKLGAASR
ncbi:MAG: putative rane protein [Phycisphaerales bacterium]|nr:putative rane protein [Phycisphaerales bacterium]